MSKRGKKDCPNCNKEIGARTSICDCGYYFLTKEVRLDLLKEKKEKGNNKNKVYDEIKMGRKKCPSCDIIIGAVIKICFKCNFDFIAAKKERLEKEEKEKQEKKEAREKKKKTQIEEREKRREERVKNKGKNKREGTVHPEVKKLMDSQELIEKMNDVLINGAKYFTPEEHANRILKYGENRAKSLLRQHKNGSKWSHINWDVVEEGLKEKV